MNRYELLHGDCLEKLKGLPDNSVDAVVTDPPYDLTSNKKGGSGQASLNTNSPAGRSRIGTGFMGKAWDGTGIAFRPDVWLECLRVLKPGGHLLAFGGTRTHHRMACAIEDAGFEIRDSIHWMYGSGFPKGLRPVPHMWQHAKSCLSKEAAPHVVQVSPCLRPALHAGKERTALALAVIQPEGVPALLTETGREDGSSEVTVTLLSESEMRQAATDWSMISSWRGSSDDAFDAVNTSIIETTSNTITVQKILSCLIGQNTPSSIRYSVTLPDGSQWPACGAESLLSGERLKSQHIPVLTALAPATRNPIRDWLGWNVNLKPSHEPIVVARKPLIGTVAENVLKWGTGAINVDGCRVGADTIQTNRYTPGKDMTAFNGSRSGEPYVSSTHTGRWPPNLLFSHLPECGEAECAEGCAVRELDEQSGTSKTPRQVTRGAGGQHGTFSPIGAQKDIPCYGDSGGASRFFPVFRYQAKAPPKERKVEGVTGQHPTQKPEALMKWLVRLVTPPNGLVLDPFTGSGSTGVAALLEGFRFIGCEREDEYFAIAKARLEHALKEQPAKKEKQATLFDLEAP